MVHIPDISLDILWSNLLYNSEAVAANDELVKDEVASDIKKYTKLSKEQASLKAPYEAYEEYNKLWNETNIRCNISKRK